LYPASDGVEAPSGNEPEFFRDLNLDQIVAAVTAGRESYDLKPFFYAPLTTLDQIAFRHEIMRDLENEALFASLKAFSERMLAMRECLAAEKAFNYQHQKERALLGAAASYCEAAAHLRSDLDATGARSRGLLAIRDYLARYVESAAFQALAQQAQTVIEGLASIRYCVLINEANVTVRSYEAEIDYSAEVESTFAIFKQGAVKDYRIPFQENPEMNYVEAMILDFVVKLNPAPFAALDEFYAKHPSFSEQPILEFDRGIQFYLAYAEYMARFKGAGLNFCYPQVSDSSKAILSRNGFDLALASKLVASNTPPVCNDFELTGAERLMVVTGPNQGGKTTFARAFGQLHYLAGLGYPVPGTEARLFLADRFFTHFDSEEDIKNLQGKLKDDLVRMNRILEQATPKSLVVMNEIFASTSLEDATYLGKKVLTRFAEIDGLGVCVTFLDELASLNEKTVSMMATIVPENPSQRTFRIARRSASGLSYAMALAEKYQLTYEHLQKRITR
jgi:DNA mismatch repair ATPase MutS